MIRDTAALKKKQATPDDPEALATLPSLSLSDIDPKTPIIPTEIRDFSGSTVLTHDLFTNGILYVDVAFDLQGVPARLLPLVPLFGKYAPPLCSTAPRSETRMPPRVLLKTTQCRFVS